MSFNLNKNEGPSVPPGRSTFDLSKSTISEQTLEPKKPAYWLIGLIALFIIGGVTWYFTKGNTAVTSPVKDTTVNTSSSTGDSPAMQSDTVLPAPQTTGGNSATAQSTPVLDGSTVEDARPEGPAAQQVSAAPVLAASFDAGSTSPRIAVGGVVEQIRNKSKSNENVKIRVYGYASSEGSLEVNQKISQNRADAYKRMLIRKGIKEGTISAQGKGIENPIATNDTEAGRRKNRRVEVSY